LQANQNAERVGAVSMDQSSPRIP